MRASIIIIGDEILLGRVTDTNSGAIARALTPLGWEIVSIATVGDNAADIAEAVRRALSRSPLVITTGGLGPTKDDITKGVLTEIFGGELRADEAVAENARRIFAERGLEMNALTETQALVPSSCSVICNRYGTAPVMWFEQDGRVLVSMPGVPFETEGMLPDVAGRVAARFHPDVDIRHSSVMVAGICESALAERLAPFEASLGEGIHLAYLPQPGLIHLRLDGTGRAGSDIAARHGEAVARLHDELGDLIIHDGEASAAAIVTDALRRRGLTLATAESCTGGNIARSITAVAGASDVFAGTVVSYSNEVKARVLGVKQATLDSVGAVSREVVEQMADGARRVIGTDIAVATSGIAGPGGATPGKPVGTVWMAWAGPGGVTSRLFRFPGNRNRVIERATTEALLGILKSL